MKCRKCNAEIPDNSIRCVHCGIKVNMQCPNCNALVPFGTKLCSSCGFQLIKICPECGTSNLFSALECRKCKSSLIEKEETKDTVKQEEIEKKEIIIEETENPYEENNTESEIVRAFSADTFSYRKKLETDSFQLLKNKITNNELEQIKKEKTVPRFFNIEQEEQDKIDNNENEIETKDEQIEKSEAITQSSSNKNIQNENNLIDENITVENIEEYIDEEVKESLDSEQKEIDDFEEKIVNGLQNETAKKVTHIIKNSIKKQIIGINGPEGVGKTAVLRQVQDYLTGNGFVFLYGSCTPLVQITSFGFFQDAFLRIMGFPPFIKSTESFIKDFKKSNFSNFFSFLDTNELNLFLNIIYPSKMDKFENIIENKLEMFSVLEKVIKSLSVNNNLVITIDNFDLLDGASYDFIVHMLQKGFFTNRVKLLVAYQENKAIQSYFDISQIDETQFEMITLNKLTNNEMLLAIKRSLSLDIQNLLPEDYIEEVLTKSDGNALRIEQEIALLFNTGYISVKDNEILINDENRIEIQPASFEELIKLRLNSLSPSAKNVLFMAAIMGYRFSTSILCLSVTMPPSRAEKMLEFLKQEMFITPVDNYTCEFKSLTLWKLIYQEAKADLLYKENAERLYHTLRPLILSSNLQKLISCTDALNKNEAFLIWKNTASLSAKLGDTNLYVIAQKQCLKIMEEQEFDNEEELKCNIYEQIGKILCEKSPNEAVTYLSNVLDAEIKAGNINKIIDISGYFIKSCYISGNYFGVTESIDAIISNIEKTGSEVTELDIALIKTRKLKALLNIGNCEQIINIVNEEIISEIDRELLIRQNDSHFKYILIDAWLSSKTILAKAYAMQGNYEVFNVINSLKSFTEKYDYNAEYFSLQIDLIEAFAHTITGDINQSNDILNNISANHQSTIIEPELLSEWNLINVVNRILLNQNEGLKADLFELATFTNNINEHFTKNIIKLILGYVLKEENNTQKALEIFNEEITYFAKEKVAIGALLSWLLIVQITIDMGDDEKALNTAIKSLEIAQSPKINNYIFIIYFQKYIAEIYLRKGDLTAAKMYIEKSVMIAKQFNLRYQLIELYLSYGEYMQELMRLSKNYSASNVNLTTEMYNKSVLAAKELRLKNLIEKALKGRNEFKTFCQLNSIG